MSSVEEEEAQERIKTKPVGPWKMWQEKIGRSTCEAMSSMWSGTMWNVQEVGHVQTWQKDLDVQSTSSSRTAESGFRD